MELLESGCFFDLRHVWRILLKTFRVSRGDVPVHVPLISKKELERGNQRAADSQDQGQKSAAFAGGLAGSAFFIHRKMLVRTHNAEFSVCREASMHAGPLVRARVILEQSPTLRIVETINDEVGGTKDRICV